MGIFKRFFGVDLAGPPKDRCKGFEGGLYSRLKLRARLSDIDSAHDEIKADMKELYDHCTNFEMKLAAVNRFLVSQKVHDITHINHELENIRKITVKENKDDKIEDKYVLKALHKIEKCLSSKYIIDADDIRDDLTNLKKDIENLQPVLRRQLEFLEMPIDEQVNHIKDLLFDIHEEGVIIGAEKQQIAALKQRIEKLEVEQILKD